MLPDYHCFRRFSNRLFVSKGPEMLKQPKPGNRQAEVFPLSRIPSAESTKQIHRSGGDKGGEQKHAYDKIIRIPYAFRPTSVLNGIVPGPRTPCFIFLEASSRLISSNDREAFRLCSSSRSALKPRLCWEIWRRRGRTSCQFAKLKTWYDEQIFMVASELKCDLDSRESAVFPDEVGFKNVLYSRVLLPAIRPWLSVPLYAPSPIQFVTQLSVWYRFIPSQNQSTLVWRHNSRVCVYFPPVVSSCLVILPRHRLPKDAWARSPALLR